MATKARVWTAAVHAQGRWTRSLGPQDSEHSAGASQAHISPSTPRVRGDTALAVYIDVKPVAGRLAARDVNCAMPVQGRGYFFL